MTITSRRKRRPMTTNKALNDSTNTCRNSNSNKKQLTTTIGKKKKVNNNKTNSNSTSSKAEKEVAFREGMFKFYETPRGVSLETFCNENDFKYKAFNLRWNGSELRKMNPKKKLSPPPPPLSIAKLRYDEWYTTWQEGLRQQRVFARANDKSTPFAIHIDDEIDEHGTNDSTANNGCGDSSNGTSIGVADAGDDNVGGDGEVILCASYAAGKCKTESPVVIHPKAHVCIQCKKPMHAICGCGDQPDKLLICAVCYETAESTNAKNDDRNNTSIPKKDRAKRLSPKEMRDFLVAFYVNTDTKIKLATYAKENNLESNIKAIRSHWTCSGLSESKLGSETVPIAFEQYDEWLLNEDDKRAATNKENGSKNQAIPEEVRKALRELVKQLAFCGQGLPRRVIEMILKTALDDHHVSRRTLDRFISQYDLRCKGVKNISPIRISQVTPEKRDAFFHRLDANVKLCHQMDPINCPWKDWESVDADCKSNLDEMASNQTSALRDKIIIPKELTGRIFQQTPQGDKTDRHVTLIAFSRSDGKYHDKLANIEGAAPPIIIHAQGQKKRKDTTTAGEKRMKLYDDPILPKVDDHKFLDGLDDHKDLGLEVLTSINGSMTKELFPFVCSHIIEYLAADQGSNGKYTFLLMDSHVSRWHPRALYLLFKHRIIPLFFPSHLTIVAQPQDNGVILYLHKCLEEASLIPRLFATQTDLAFCNSVIATGYTVFREGERKKLLTRGRNSTTGAYRKTGIEPRNPLSEGWDENLRLYANYNGMKITNKEGFFCYGVTPKDAIACPPFSETDIELLNDAVPMLVSEEEDDKNIFNDPTTKCYIIADRLVNDFMELQEEDRPSRPVATTDVEKVALRRMTIAQIVTAKSKPGNAMILDKYYNDKKLDAMLTIIKPQEIIQVKPKDSEDKHEWWNAIRMNKDNTWNVCDGDVIMIHTTTELEEQYTINIAYFMFPHDKRLISNGYKTDRRRKNEKQSMMKKIAQNRAEEERDVVLLGEFHKFMALSPIDQTYIKFKQTLMKQIEEPSDHVIKVNFESEIHEIKVCAHGNNTSSMPQLVANAICRTIIGNIGEKEKNNSSKKRGGSRVTRTTWGSDGFAKEDQINQEFHNDVDRQLSSTERKKKAAITLGKSRIKAIAKLQAWSKYDSIWTGDDSTIQLNAVSGKCLQYLLTIFNVKGRSKHNNTTRAKTALSQLYISRGGIDHLTTQLVAELSDLVEKYDLSDAVLNLSFADASFNNDDSILLNDSMVDANSVDTSAPLLYDNDEASEAEEDQYEGESEISAGDGSDSGSNNDNNNRNNSGRKSVSFRRKPFVRIIPSRMKKTEHELDREKYNSWVGRRITRDLSLDDDVDDNTCMEGSIKEAWMYEGSWYFEIVYEGVLDSNGNPDTEDISLCVLADTCTFHDDTDISTGNDNDSDDDDGRRQHMKVRNEQREGTYNEQCADSSEDESSSIDDKRKKRQRHKRSNNLEQSTCKTKQLTRTTRQTRSKSNQVASTVEDAASSAEGFNGVSSFDDEKDNDKNACVPDSLLQFVVEADQKSDNHPAEFLQLSPIAKNRDDNDYSFVSDSLLTIVAATGQKLTNVLEESSGTPIAENRDDDDYSVATADDAGLEVLQAMTADDAGLEVLQTRVFNPSQPTDSQDSPPGISTAVSNEDNVARSCRSNSDDDDSDDDSFLSPPKIKLNVGDEIEFFREGATHGDPSSLKSSVVRGIRPDEKFILNLTSGNSLYRDHLIRILPDGCFRSIDTFTLEKSGEQEWIGGQMRDTTERFKKVRAAIDNKIEIYWSNVPGQEIGDDVDKENESPTIIHDQIDHQAANTIDQRTLRRSNRRPTKK